MDPATAIHYLTFIPAILVAITFHEFAHARVALHFGDTTALREGRVTLNPLAHLDPLGTFGMLFLGFGWGKPVPVDRSAMRSPRADFYVSAAGPTSNLVIAAVCGVIYQMPGLGEWLELYDLRAGTYLLLYAVIRFNLVLALFNFLPIYPLDGSHMLENLLPLNAAARFHDFNRHYGHVVMIGLIASGYLLPVSPVWLLLGPPMEFLLNLLTG